jgi:hypothetical protein
VQRHFLLRSLLLIAVYGLAACEDRTTVSITAPQNPPTFKLSGSGGVFLFIFIGPHSTLEEIGSNQEVHNIWRVSPVEGTNITASYLPTLTYGQVPPGFRQDVPASGSPPPLEEGKFYSVRTPTHGANFQALCFKMEGGNAVELPCPAGY